MRIFWTALVALLLAPAAQADPAHDCNQSFDFKLRLTACTELIELHDHTDENLAAAYTNRGRAHYALGDAERALADFDRAVELRPDAQSYSNRGSANFALQKLEAAQADFEKAVEIAPDYADALHNLGLIHLSAGRQQKALGYFDAAITADPDVQNTHAFRARLNCKLGNHDQSVADYLVVLSRDKRLVPQAIKSFVDKGLMEGPATDVWDDKAETGLTAWVRAGCE